MTLEDRFRELMNVPNFRDMNDSLYAFAVAETEDYEVYKFVLTVVYSNQSAIIKAEQDNIPIPEYATSLTRRLWRMYCAEKKYNEFGIPLTRDE